jgi:antirestriction protein ArdC
MAKQRKNKYVAVGEKLTKQITEAVERGEKVLWQVPHYPGDQPRGFDGNVYRGMNYWLLSPLPHEDRRYITRNRAISLLKDDDKVMVERTSKTGAKYHALVPLIPVIEDDEPVTEEVRVVNPEGVAVGRRQKVEFFKGHRNLAHEVVLQKPMRYKVEKEDGSEEQRQSFFIRTYFVFNVGHVNPAVPIPAAPVHPELEVRPIAAAEAVLAAYKDCPPIKRSSAHTPMWVIDLLSLRDEVRLPTKAQFKSNERMWDTTFHELIHSTGHPHRLNRMTAGGFGSQTYAFEELVAQMGASMLSDRCGLMDRDVERQSVAYMRGWLRALKDEPTWLLKAASRAQRAVDYMLGTVIEYENSGDESSSDNDEPVAQVVPIEAGRRGRAAA